MNASPTVAAAKTGERVMVSADSRAARWLGRLILVGAFGWLLLLAEHDHHTGNWHTSSRVAWSLSLSVAVIFAGRGILIGRPVTTGHAAAAAVVLLTGLGAHLLSLELVGDGLIAGTGMVLTWPMASRPEPQALPRVWALINATHGDPLAPFAMQSTKSYFFGAGGTAVIAYRTRLGFAVVSGDPIGREAEFPALADEFGAMCRSRGWRIIVLACSRQRLALWRDTDLAGRPLRAIPIGRDVVVDVSRFRIAGRQYRNLRQAVQRTYNAGITTQVVSEGQLDDTLFGELTEVVRAAHRSAHLERGFSMILDHALQGRYPGVKLIIARDRTGRVQGFQRYATAGGGSDVTLDVPWRRPGAPNGTDERLSVDMIADCRNRGGRRLSLAFAAFPEIFDNKNRSVVEAGYYLLIHVGRSLIKLESLYRYLRKFHAFGQRRYVLLSIRHIPATLVVLLSLEFVPRRRRLPAEVHKPDPSMM